MGILEKKDGITMTPVQRCILKYQVFVTYEKSMTIEPSIHPSIPSLCILRQVYAELLFIVTAYMMTGSEIIRPE